MIIILMGVSGSGKTTVGTILADSLGWDFIEGDRYHPPANVTKMSRGVPLTDSDRKPWLIRLNEIIRESALHGTSLIVACSALKQSYRDMLTEGVPDARFVFLKGNQALIADRLSERSGHYMPPSLLSSQFEALEELIAVDIGPSPVDNAITIKYLLGL